MDIVESLIALAGAIAGSAFLADWLKRRDRRTSIARDIDVWAKLPEGSTKTRLMSQIEQRLNDMNIAPSEFRRRWLRGTIGAYGGIGVLLLSQFVGGSYSLHRHSDGLLWLYTSQGPYQPFATSILWYLIGPIAVAYIMTVLGNYTVADLTDWVRGLWRRRNADAAPLEVSSTSAEKDSLPPTPEKP